MKKRSDGRYQQSIMVGYQSDGKPRRVVVYGKTQKEVKDKSADIRTKHGLGLFVDSNVTVLEWSRSWMLTYKQGVSEGTQRMYLSVINNHVLPSLGYYKLRDIKPAHLQTVVNGIADMPRTAEQFKLTMSQMFKKAIANDLLVKNPADAVQLPVSFKKQKKRALTDGEVSLIHSLELDERTRCFVYLLMYTGMRRGEALAITKNDIDFISLSIHVNKGIVFSNNKSSVKDSPKTMSGVRSIPLLAPLVPILKDYVNGLERDSLFTTQDGESISLMSFKRMWGKFERAVGTKEITPHIFRHNFATVLYNAGVDVKAAQVILGHSSVSVTMDIYTHLGYKNKSDSTNKLNAFFSNVSD